MNKSKQFTFLTGCLTAGLCGTLMAAEPTVNGLFYGDGDYLNYPSTPYATSAGGSKLYLTVQSNTLYLALVADRLVNDNVFSPQSDTDLTDSAGWNSHRALNRLIDSEFASFTLDIGEGASAQSYDWQQGTGGLDDGTKAKDVSGENTYTNWVSDETVAGGTGTPPPGIMSSSSIAWNLNHYAERVLAGGTNTPAWDMGSGGAKNWYSPYDTNVTPKTVLGLEGYPTNGVITYNSTYEWEWPLVWEWSLDLSAYGEHPVFVVTGISHHSPPKAIATQNDQFLPEDYPTNALSDFGDLPGVYPTTLANSGAYHNLDVAGAYLGGPPDTEVNGLPDTTAVGDDGDGADDEDGVQLLTPLVPGSNATIRVTVGNDGAFSAFIDFDGDGTLDTVTLVSATGPTALTPGTIGDMVLTNGTYDMVISVPSDAAGIMPARFRITNDPGEGGNSTTGKATSGEIEDYIWTSSIGDFVWDDLDGDGIQDAGEPGVTNVTVTLYDSETNVVDTTTTDGSGNYQFTGLLPGDYTVGFSLPAGYSVSPQDQGSDDSVDSDVDPVTFKTATVTLFPGDSDLTVDAGIYVPVQVGDRVWYDDNSDGIQDAGETNGVSGVDVVLYDNTSGLPVATNTTDASGSYLFTGLPPGDYYVIFDPSTLPGSYAFTQQNQGGDDALDSDADTTTGQTAATGALASGDSDLTLDAGIFLATLVSVGDRVWIDEDGDGVQDAGETNGVAGVDVVLYDNTSGLPVSTNTTDASGSYLFTGLPPGDYYVIFDPTTLPGSYVFTQQNQGGDDALDSDADTTTGQTPATGALAAGESDLTLDVGLYAPISVGDLVWIDEDGDGVQDAGETNGVSGVDVILYDNVSGLPVATNTTGVAGDYLFSGLPPGDYYVIFDPATLPGGSVFTVPNQGGDDAADSDADTTTGQTAATGALTSGDTDLTLDAGVYIPVSVGDLVWVDEDGDGVQGATETNGVAGVDVILYDNVSGLPIATNTTGTAGDYLFTGLPPGDYYVVFDPATLPGGSVFTTPNQGGDDAADSDADTTTGQTAATGALASGDSDVTLDAGIVYPASLGNYVWLDENRDGLQDAGEPGIPNVMVLVSNTASGVVYTNRTDANGEYLFTGLLPGSYTVGIPAANFGSGAPLDGMGQTTNPVLPGADFGNQTAPYSVTLASGDVNLTADFGYNVNPNDDPLKGAIGDRVWIDVNGDGAQYPGEIGLGGVDLVLYGDPDGDGVYDTPLATNTTDATGSYMFTDLPAGGYVVAVDTNTLPAGYTQTGDPDEFGLPATAPDNQTTIPVVLAPGDVFINADFGYQPTGDTGSIGDRVWLDADADGVQDAGESGIAGVTVSLIQDTNGNGTWNAGEPIIATDITDTNGIYGFSGLPVTDGVGTDDYLVWVNDASGILSDLEQTFDDDGIATPDISAVADLTTTPVTDQDFGYTPAGQDPGEGLIGDTIFHDRDDSGTPDDGEGLAGVTVTLSDTNGTVLATATTDGNGNYFFGGLDTNTTYTVTVDTSTLPPGLTNSVDPDGGLDSTSEVDLSADPDGIDLDQDFGYRADPSGTVGSIGNLVWLDINADGDVDAGEQGIEGVTIDLYADSNGNGKVDPGEPKIGTTTTAADGSYLFSNLPADNNDYIVDVIDTAGVLAGHWHSTGIADTDNNSQVDPYAVTLTPAVPDNLTADFGYYVKPAALGNRVWFDVDGDGIQESGDYGMTNVTVTLTIAYPDGTTNTLITLSDTNGYYSFGNLLLDEDMNGVGGGEPQFILSVGNVSNFNHTVQDAGGASDAEDSDNPMGVTAVTVQGQNNTALLADPTAEGSIAWYDFGFTITPTLAVITGVRSEIENGVAVISWDVALELETVGYYLERDVAGQWARINETMIPAQIFMPGIKTYSQPDPDAPLGTTQRYRIVELDWSGNLNAYGPYELALDGGEVSFDSWAAGIDWNGADASAGEDPDGDGLTNFEEYLAGTDPLNATSVLRITQVNPANGGMEVSWQSEAGRIYTVQMSLSLDDEFWPVATGIPAVPPENSYVVPVDTAAAGQAFFRVLVD